jgi:hypothetical protein
MLALGMAFAVLIDASLVRMILVPSVMTLLGRSAWYLPGWMQPIVPHLHLEEAASGDGTGGDGETGESVPSDAAVGEGAAAGDEQAAGEQVAGGPQAGEPRSGAGAGGGSGQT